MTKYEICQKWKKDVEEKVALQARLSVLERTCELVEKYLVRGEHYIALNILERRKK